jgi:TRAP-type C4-dicarboxylate transport system permease small subunit
MSDPVTRISRILQRIEEFLLAYAMLLIALLTIANVFTRVFLGISLAFAEELAQFGIIVVTFVGLSYAASQGRHIRMTAIYDQLSLRLQKVLMIVITATTSVLMFALAYYAVLYVETVYELGTVSPALQVPLYLVYLTAPLGFVLAGMQYALTVVKNLRTEEVYLSYEQKDEYEDAEVGI